MVDLAQAGHIHMSGSMPVASNPTERSTFYTMGVGRGLYLETEESLSRPTNASLMRQQAYEVAMEAELKQARKRRKFDVPYVEVRFFMPNCSSDSEPYEIRHATDADSMKSCAAMLKSMKRTPVEPVDGPRSRGQSPLVSAPSSDCGWSVDG